ncbi:MAG: hypothetical protein WC977_14585 [Anaerovoracaceae bacterium]|jgi:hypothetical protein
MFCSRCGHYEPDAPNTDAQYPEYNKEWPPYVKPEKVLRQEARTEDWGFFRSFASSIHLSDWDKTVEARKRILHSWDQFLMAKYGPDRGLDCNAPQSTAWDKTITPAEWLAAHFNGDSTVLGALAAFEPV